MDGLRSLLADYEPVLIAVVLDARGKTFRDDLFAQYLLPRGDELRPSAHIGEAKAWASQNMGSIILSVQEVRNASEQQRRESPAGHRLPVNLWENFSYLFYVNTKAVK